MAGELLPTYVLLTDAPPLKEGGHGCHMLAWNWMGVVGRELKLVVTRKMNPSLSIKNVISDLQVPSVIYPDLSRVPFPGRVRGLRSVLELIIFACWLPRICARIRISGAQRIFALFGGNAWFLFVTSLVARWTKLPLDIYLVDDLEASAHLAGQPSTAKLARWLEPRVLRAADRVFAISPGLGEYLFAKYGIQAEWLPIPILNPKVQHVIYRPTVPDVRDIAFLGAVNPLYLSALRDVLEEIRYWNETQKGFKLRLLIMTYSNVAWIDKELRYSSDMKILYRRSTEECRVLLARSWAIFLPYSFEPEHRLMVSTSFPSKLAENLPAGRPLLAYGPEYASLARYFRENNLPICVTSRSGFTDAFRSIEPQDTVELIKKYQTVLQRWHTPGAIRDRLRLTHSL